MVRNQLHLDPNFQQLIEGAVVMERKVIGSSQGDDVAVKVVLEGSQMSAICQWSQFLQTKAKGQRKDAP